MAPVTDTDSIRAWATPSTLIWVCGDASGVPLAGEIVSDAAPAGAAGNATARAHPSASGSDGRVKLSDTISSQAAGDLTGTHYNNCWNARQLESVPMSSTPDTSVSVPRGRRLSPDARREHILEAARQVFSQRPYAGVSTRDIAEAAGVARSLVHHYFGGIAEVFMAVVAQGGASLDDVRSAGVADPVRRSASPTTSRPRSTSSRPTARRGLRPRATDPTGPTRGSAR